MPHFIEEEKKIEKEANQVVRNEFLKIGVAIEKYPQIFERLVEINNNREGHFYDAIKMAEIVDLIWENLDLKGISKEKMKLCILVHDIGKSGPLNISENGKKIIKKLFQHRPFKDSRDKPISLALAEENIEGRDEINKFLSEELKIDTNQEKMIDFWRRHVDWSYEILKNNRSDLIDEEVILIVAAHHLLDGKDPAQILAKGQEVSLNAQFLEIIDKYQILTLIDKYQAYRGRSNYSHEEAILYLKDLVEKSNFSEKTKQEYLKFVDILDKSRDKLKELTY